MRVRHYSRRRRISSQTVGVKELWCETRVDRLMQK
jgi:hypothetical protein